MARNPGGSNQSRRMCQRLSAREDDSVALACSLAAWSWVYFVPGQGEINISTSDKKCRLGLRFQQRAAGQRDYKLVSFPRVEGKLHHGHHSQSRGEKRPWNAARRPQRALDTGDGWCCRLALSLRRRRLQDSCPRSAGYTRGCDAQIVLRYVWTTLCHAKALEASDSLSCTI